MIKDYFDKEFTILTVTKVTDGMGGFTETWNEDVNSNFKGALRLLNANEFSADQRKSYDASHVMNCDSSVSLNRKNRVRCEGIDYEIKWIKDVRGHHQKVFLKEIE